MAEVAQSAGIQTVWLRSQPARVWDADGAAKKRPAPADDGLAPLAAAAHSPLDQLDRHRDECVDACAGATVIVFNLFALEGFHIAESMGVPAVAASPCLSPASLPAAAERALHRYQPALCAQLEARGVWPEGAHWMWPLLNSQRWGAWRHHCLGLPAAPDGGSLAVPPLLYGISEALVPRPGHWPESVTLTGAWHVSCGQLPPAAAAFMQQAGDGGEGRPVCVDVGSMGLMGLIPDATFMARVVVAAAEAVGRRLVVLTGGWRPLAAAFQAAAAAGGGRVLVLEAAVPHDALLPRCAAVLHHGGAGTVAAAARCGVPSVVAPLHFDQPQWAERVEWAGLGVQLPGRVLCPPGGADADAEEADLRAAAARVAQAMRTAMHNPGVAAGCRQMQQLLAGEGGAAAAARAVLLYAAAWTPPPPAKDPQPLSAPAVRLRLPRGLDIFCLSSVEAAFIHDEIFRQGVYLRHGIALPARNAVVLDVGANVGIFSLHLLLPPELGGLGGRQTGTRVFAFEPIPQVADLLARNLSAHGVEGSVRLAREGLHSDPSVRRLPFTFYPALPGNSTAAPEEKYRRHRRHLAPAAAAAALSRAQRVDCAVATLAQVAAREGLRRIDLLKVDVEGWEVEVLRGADDACWRAARQAVVEVHDVEGSATGGGGRVAEARELLEGQGFAVEEERCGGTGTVLLYATRLPAGGD